MNLEETQRMSYKELSEANGLKWIDLRTSYGAYVYKKAYCQELLHKFMIVKALYSLYYVLLVG